jgi:uncharacterized protein YjcR
MEESQDPIQGYKLNKIAELVGCYRNTVAKWVKRGQR